MRGEGLGLSLPMSMPLLKALTLSALCCERECLHSICELLSLEQNMFYHRSKAKVFLALRGGVWYQLSQLIATKRSVVFLGQNIA